MARADSAVPEGQPSQTAFVPLPVRHGDILRILGPKPEEAAIAVDPLVKLDKPLTVVQSFVAGLCAADGRLIEPVELTLAVDPATIVPNEQVPSAAVLRRFNALPQLLAELPPPAGFELLRDAIADSPRGGPLLYCRKRQCVFMAHSPNTAEPLRAASAAQGEDAAAASRDELPLELLSWDGPAAGDRVPTVYGGAGGDSALGAVAALEQLLLDQGKVVARAVELEKNDPAAAARLAVEHGCVTCPERERCYPQDDGYAYVADRLVAISAVAGPLVFGPLGEWRFDQASRIIGGLPPGECHAGRDAGDNEFELWCAQRAQAIERAGPAWLLSSEGDGRELIEVGRLKLGLIVDLLEQLDATWRAGGRPHLCWNEQTVRVAWRRPVAIPATCWGFRALVRKIGLQPEAPCETADGAALPYPPAFSDPSLLPPEVVDAARCFDEPRPVGVFVKSSRAAGEKRRVQVLLEDTGIAWELFSASDSVQLVADGWQAVLSPAAERDPDDGEGLPFAGVASGEVAGLKKGEQRDGVTLRWHPRFGEAVDLHAVGMLVLEALLAHDERNGRVFREQIGQELDELAQACRALPVEQREAQARSWLGERCEADAPAATWTRRNLLFRRDDRNATRIEAFPSDLWQAVITFGLRLTTRIAGFSFCPDRSCAAPRGEDGLLLPLAELRGLVALLDDVIFGRRAPAAAVRALLRD